ncbi:MAG: DNA polymerase III subunit delta' [Micropepsaceae bacterium]
MAPRASKPDQEILPESDRAGDLPHPREREELFGHADASATLSKAARSGQLHHAWLLAGPKGVGKATLAWRFARALLAFGKGNCPDDLHVPLGHPAFRQVSALTHPDVTLLRRPWDVDKKRFKSDLPVDEVRRLKGYFSKHSTFGGPQIAIVDCMDDMNIQAQNALLKILEEPPKSAILLLITHAPGHLLPTIRSRCRLLHLRKLSDGDMVQATKSLCPGASPETLKMVSALADGVPGFAASLAESNAIATYQDLLGLLSQLPTINAAMAQGFADRIARQPIDTGIAVFSALMQLIEQRLVLTHLGFGTPLAAETNAFQRMAAAISLEEWVSLWSDLRNQFSRTEQLNLDKKQFVLNALYSIESRASKAFHANR